MIVRYNCLLLYYFSKIFKFILILDLQGLINTNDNYIDSTEDLSAYLTRRDSENCSISQNNIPNMNCIEHSTQALWIGHPSDLGEVTK